VTRIPLLDLTAQYRSIKPEIDAAVLRVLDEGQYVLGPAVARFEQALAAYCGAPEAIGVNSGTSALHLALLAVGVKPGDEVITVPFTFVATVAAIEYAGARPVFVDVEDTYYTMDPAQLEAAITPRTKAIVPVHLYGQPADMDPILEIAARYGVAVVEDACQAHGAEHRGRRCGSLGTLGCFSFYPTKNLGAYGEGGAVVTSEPTLAARIRLLRSWGEETRYTHAVRGFNYRMDALQGAILEVKLRHLDAWTNARRAHAATYGRRLLDTSAALPRARENGRHAYHAYVIRVRHRDVVRARLADAGVQTGVHYQLPVHLQSAYADLGYTRGDFPVAERLAGEVLSLPMFPELTEHQIEIVAGIIRTGVPAAAPV
jgi:dTDP-4-amino-4,6-dideoxygalactose transaminase